MFILCKLGYQCSNEGMRKMSLTQHMICIETLHRKLKSHQYIVRPTSYWDAFLCLLVATVVHLITGKI